MLKNKVTVANLFYKANCVGYRLFSITNDNVDVYDVMKDVGDEYGLAIIADRDILMIPDGTLLLTKDEIDNNYVVTDITENISVIETILGDYKGLIEDEEDTNMDEENDMVIDDMYTEEDEEDTNIDEENDMVIDDMYTEEDEEELNNIPIDILNRLCAMYLKPTRETKLKGQTLIPVNLDIEVGSELKNSKSDLDVSVVSVALINKMFNDGYDYKSRDELNNGMMDGSFIKRV